MKQRYLKNIGFITEAEQKRLFSCHAVIVGGGGLGGTVFEILLRFGIGKITIADFDKFEESNLNRQLLSSEDTIGQSKAAAACERAKKINSTVKVVSLCEKITPSNAKNIFKSADVIIDCLGNIKDRFVIEKAARSLGIPLVHAAVACESGQVMTIMPSDPGLASIYGPEKDAPPSGEEVSKGVPPSAVMAIASIEAHEAIKVLLERKDILQNTLLKVDLQNWTMKRFAVHG